jgi:hypothetical protein
MTPREPRERWGVPEADPRAVMAGLAGYVDAVQDLRANASVVDSEYRRYYMRGYIRGRTRMRAGSSFAELELDPNLDPPDLVNEGDKGIVDDS